VLKGDWHKVEKMLGQIAPKLQSEAEKATAESLQLIEKTVVGHLDNQDLNWPPLAEGTMVRKLQSQNPKLRRRKIRAGRKVSSRRLSEKILIATGAYRNAITSYQINPYSGEVGVARNETNKDGEEIVNIGMVHEDGTRDGRIPARELWEPSAKEVEDDIVNNYEKAAKRALNV